VRMPARRHLSSKCRSSPLLQADLCVDVGGALHRAQRPHLQRTPEPHCSDGEGGDGCSPALHRVGHVIVHVTATSRILGNNREYSDTCV